MMTSWWWIWLLLMFLLLVPPIGYGSFYRGWGAPYPRYIQRRRGQRAATVAAADANAAEAYNHQSWGMGGDYVWTILLVGMLWASYMFYWRAM